MFKTWLTCFTKFKVERVWEIFICFWSQYLIRFGLTTIKKVAFLLLLEWCISGAAKGVGISKVSYMTSITISSEDPLSASIVRRFLSWLRCLLWINCWPFIIYMFPILFLIVPISQKDLSLKILKKTFSGIILFWGYDACSSRLCLFLE